jgi:hypothetical protein
MANLASSGQISLDDIIKNRTGAAGTNVSLKDESEAFASGSEVDGNVGQTTARKNLIEAPYAISELHDADFNTDSVTSVTVTTDGSDTNTVDGEDIAVAFETGTGGTWTVQLIDSSGNIDGSTTRSGQGTVTFSSVNIDADTYRARIKQGFATQDDDATFTHHDLIGAVSIADPSDTTVAASSTTHDIDHDRSINNVTSLNDYNWTFAKSSGDGSNPNPTSATTSQPTVRYTGPGIYTANLRVDGTPTQARNSTTATQVSHRIDYTAQVTIANPSNVNQGTNYNVTGNHKGHSGGIQVDEILASNNSVLSSNDDSTDSRIASTDYSQAITPSTGGGNNTRSVQVKAHNNSVSATSNAFSIFPLLTTGKNTINAGVNTVYSSTNNSAGNTFNGDSTSYVNTVAYGTPGTATDNVTTHAYTINTAPTGWSFSAASSATTNFAGGTGVAKSKTVTLTVTSTAAAGDSASDQSTATTHTLAVLFKPCIIAITHTAGTIVVNDTDVVVTALSWQGFGEATGFKLAGVNASGQLVSENNDVTYGNTEGDTDESISKTSLSINLGNFDTAGTMRIRVKQHNATSTFRDFNITISDYTSTVIQGVGAGYGTPEQALVAKLAGGAGWANTTKKFAPGDSFGNGIILYNNNAGQVFNGGAVYHGTKPSSTTSYFSVGTNGAIGNIFVGDAAIPPRAPSSLSNSASITGIAVSNYSVSNYTFSASGTTTGTFDSKVTTKTVTVSFSDNSVIEEGYEVFENNSSGTSVAEENADSTSAQITGITGNKTYAVHAVGNSVTGGGSVLSLGTVTTGYTHSNSGTLYLQATNNSGGATVDLGTATGTGSGTQTITWDKDVLVVGTWTVRLRRTSYTGTQVAIDSSVVVAGSFGAWSAEMFVETDGNSDTDESAEVTIVYNSSGGTVRLSTTTSTGGSNISLDYRTKVDGGTFTGYSSNPQISVGAGSITIVVQAKGTQSKEANTNDTDVIILTDTGTSVVSPNEDVNWDVDETP